MTHEEDRMQTEEKARQPSPAGTAVIDPPKAEVPAPTAGPTVIKVDAELWAKILQEREQTQALLDQIRTERLQPDGPVGSVRRPIVARAMPPHYVVWLGPEPKSGQVYRSVRGTVQVINSDKQYEMVDGNGDGKKRTIRGTENTGVLGEYVDAGRTSIDFVHRCPPNHRYAGRLFAVLTCPEHAAWLHLFTPDGRGRDRDGNKVYAFHLAGNWIQKYQVMKDVRMNQRKMQEVDVDWVASDGVEMPFAE